MSIHVEFTISTDRFELGNFIEGYDNLVAELEQVVPAQNRAIPYVRVTGPASELDSLTKTFKESEKITSVTVLDKLTIPERADYQYLYRIDWILDDLDIIKGIINADGDILEGESMGSYWNLRFRFDNHDKVAEFYQFLTTSEITDFTIESIFELDSRKDQNEEYELTTEQRKALTIAAQQGYFENPRGITLAELGDELNITQQAASQRVRRALRNVVFQTLNIPDQSV